MTHILLHQKATGNPFLLPVALTAVMPSNINGCGCVRFDGREIMTVETHGELIAVLPQGTRVIVPAISRNSREHAQAINERAAQEGEMDATLAARRIQLCGSEIANAVAFCRRRDLMLPDAPPVLNEAGKISDAISGNCLIELAKALEAMDASEMEKCVLRHRAEMELRAGGDA